MVVFYWGEAPRTVSIATYCLRLTKNMPNEGVIAAVVGLLSPDIYMPVECHHMNLTAHLLDLHRLPQPGWYTLHRSCLTAGYEDEDAWLKRISQAYLIL